MTFEELENKTLDELIKKYKFTNPNTLKHEIKKIGDNCYKFNDLFYEPTALKRDLIYYDYLTQKHEYDALEKLKIALYCHKIKFYTKDNKINITVGTNNAEVADVEVFDEVLEKYEIFIYNRNYDYESINNRLKTLQILKKYTTVLEKNYCTAFDDIFTTNPTLNRKVMQRLSVKFTYQDDTDVTTDEINEIIKELRRGE